MLKNSCGADNSIFLTFITSCEFSNIIIVNHDLRIGICKIFMTYFIFDLFVISYDYYLKPKIGMLHPKYLYWRPIFQNFISYSKYEYFLKNNIHLLLKIKRFIDIFFFNKVFFSDCLIPIWQSEKKG